MDYFETDSNSSAPKRVPLSLRLPVQVVESVDRYASENRMSKTDAFLHFLRRGMDAERGELRLDQLVRIEYDHGMSFNLHDVSQFGKRIEQATGREVDVVSADRIKKEGLAAAIERDKELVYEREAR